MGKQCKQWQTFFSWAPKSLQKATAAMKLKDACSLEEKLWQTYDKLKSRDHYFADKGQSSGFGFYSSHVLMCELDHKEGWALKDWCFPSVVLDKTLESPLDCREIKPVNPKGNQSRIFIGRTDAEAEAPILGPSDVKSQLIGKDPDAGKDWGQEKGMTEDEKVGWHHQLNGRVWISSGSWWWTEQPGVLQSMGSQRVRHNWATEQLYTEDLGQTVSPHAYSSPRIRLSRP